MTTFNTYADFVAEYNIAFWFSKHTGKVLRRWNSLSGDSQYSLMEYQCEDEDDLNHFIQAIESDPDIDSIFDLEKYSINRETLQIQITWCLYLP